MTHLPKSELVGVLAPYSMFPNDIGKIGVATVVTAASIQAASYLGSGIVILCDGQYIWRSVDYGKNWISLGIVTGESILSSAYLGFGIVIVGSSLGHIWRSTNFGVNWTDLGAIGGANYMYSPTHMVNRLVLIFTTESKIFLSDDYGLTWNDVTPALGGQQIGIAASYLGNGIVIVGSSLGHIWRSVNYGFNWTDLGLITDASIIEYMSYLGNGIVIICSQVGNIYRSIDYGLTWSFITNIDGSNPGTLPSYFGNGISMICAANGHNWRSINYGLTWTDLGLSRPVGYSWTHLYLGNGTFIICTNNIVYLGNLPYRTEESQVNYPRIISGDLGPGGANTRLIDTVVPGTNIYTNLDKTRTLIVSVGCTCNTGVGGGAGFNIQADSGAVPSTLVSPTVGIATGLASEYNIFMTTGYVGPGLNYRLNQIIGGTGIVTLDKWFEMYI